MKVRKIILSSLILLLLMSIGVYAADKHIVDDAKVLKQDTINTVEQNLSKIEKNTDVIVKFDVVKTLNGKSIDDYSKEYAKSNISGEQYILFVTSIGDKKNKILVGDKANDILSQSDISNIVALPNSDFKANNFDSGIMKVGKALDEKVTTKAVNTGKAEVVKDGYSKTVSHKTNYFGIFIIIIVIIVIAMILFKVIKNKMNKDYEERKRKFAEENNLESYLDSDDNSFHSGNISKSETKQNYSSHGNEPDYKNNNESSSNFNNNSTRTSDNASNNYDTYPSGSHVNNTTIINNNNSNNDFLEGMIVGEMVSESSRNHHEHYTEEHGYRDDNEHYRDTSSYNSNSLDNNSSKESDSSADSSSDSVYLSGNWDSDNSTSSWESDDDSSSDSDGSSSSWGSDDDSSSSSEESSSSWGSDDDSSSSSEESSSSWDSDSDSSSSSDDSSSSSDSGSSDW
ncbi:putative membrane protein YgcG [Clostridium beijerinckii]|uniref:TPM domain-containing protein n=1 Tax=Clostridium beijerinckii TaxID=1520 RepID=UPI00156F6B78|nr:TPM domain-containing protein [Clostridium beijerinckii]NRY59147.1 putative membrane protein YgcG [Clostridium beijerinckii]